ncbi:MAG: DUF1592 domain-containing protein, partial [Planctomycetota bacterium]
MVALRLKLLACVLLVDFFAACAWSEPPEPVTVDAPATPRTFAEARSIGQQRSKYKQATELKAEVAPRPNLDAFAKSIKPILAETCVQCHGPDVEEGNLRIDTLDPDLSHGDDIDWWLEVQAVLTNGEMPPPDEVEMADEDRASIIEWLAREVQVASIVRRDAREHTSFRRMTRYELNYALQDLLGVPYDFARELPPEANSKDGFQNSSELLHMSVSQLESYRRLARKALRRVIVEGERPAVLHWGITMQDVGRNYFEADEKEYEKEKAEADEDEEKEAKRLARLEKKYTRSHKVPYFRNLGTKRTVQARWDYHRAKHAIKPSDSMQDIPESLEHVAILPRGNNERFTIELGNRVPDQGIMRVRVRASRENSGDTGDPTLALLFGWQASNEGRAVMPVPNPERVVTANPDSPEFYEWNVPLGEIYPRNSVRKSSKLGSMPNPSEYIRLANRSVSQGGIRIDYVEIATPVYEEWPPLSHQRIFIDSENRDDEQAYAREVIAAFMQRAWRRPVGDEEVDSKIRLFATMRPLCGSFEEAIVEVLATVLASPQFLYISSEAGDQSSLTAHELATRLSMFLWCSIPDAELRELADNGKLLEADTLREQVARMLSDERASRLANNFVHQWLDMQLLEFLTVPRHRKSLKQAMQDEPVRMFDELVRTNASVLDFLHADYTMANERLARHYGLADVRGNHFRRVALPHNKHRGGLLTQAGLLAMNSAGEDSHPLKRGVWLLESLLDDPPPPPPPAVPEIDLADPEIAKMTLKEQIEDHRNHAACMSCHAKIDPWGIAFENYDAQGQWRDKIGDKPVDATSELFNGQPLDGMAGLKRFLLENRQDQFVRATVHKLTTYALGRPLGFADRSAVDEITSSVRRQGDGLATT